MSLSKLPKRGASSHNWKALDLKFAICEERFIRYWPICQLNYAISKKKHFLIVLQSVWQDLVDQTLFLRCSPLCLLSRQCIPPSAVSISDPSWCWLSGFVIEGPWAKLHKLSVQKMKPSNPPSDFFSIETFHQFGYTKRKKNSNN